MFDLDYEPMTVTRNVSGEVVSHEVQALDSTTQHGEPMLFLPLNADVEEGDLVDIPRPSGRLKRVRLTQVDHLDPARLGMGMGRDLAHTEVRYELAPDAVVHKPRPVDLPGLHPHVSAAAGSKYAAGHYGDAVFAAFRAVDLRVQRLSGINDTGRGLMGVAFKSGAPVLDVTSDGVSSQTHEAESDGYRFLFMGAMAALRNAQGHEELSISADEAMEQLAFASLLMRRLDLAEARLV